MAALNRVWDPEAPSKLMVPRAWKVWLSLLKAHSPLIMMLLRVQRQSESVVEHLSWKLRKQAVKDALYQAKGLVSGMSYSSRRCAWADPMSSLPDFSIPTRPSLTNRRVFSGPWRADQRPMGDQNSLLQTLELLDGVFAGMHSQWNFFELLNYEGTPASAQLMLLLCLSGTPSFIPQM